MDLRPLVAQDWDAVVALDTKLAGNSRSAFFRRRLQAALAAPRSHLQLAIEGTHGLTGFLLARVVGGEFGRPHRTAVIEALGVAEDARHAGRGQALVEALSALARVRGITELASQARWTEHALLRLFDRAGFTLAPRHVLERGVRLTPAEEEAEDRGESRHYVRSLDEDDVAAMVAIDRRIGGSERTDYLQRVAREALSESAVQVSLVAEEDRHVVGHLIARMDWGDYGRSGGNATIHTLGVDPRFARAGHGAALLRQLLKNLAALGVERVDTEVDRGSFPLLGWFYAQGFEPSQRLAFRRPVG